MERRYGANATLAVVLVLLGVAFFLIQVLPSPQGGSWLEQGWPLILVGLGVALLVLGGVRHAPGLAIPAAILCGLGGLFLWQTYTWDWESWAYVWTLIPGFVGLGFLLEIPLGATEPMLARGEALIVISLGLFAFFTTFYSTIGLVGPWWPVLSIAVGILLFLRALVLLAAVPRTPRAKAGEGAQHRMHLRQVFSGGR